MDGVIEKLQPLSDFLGRIQDVLDFDDWAMYSNFATTRGLGRVAMIGVLLGILWGAHAAILVVSSFEACGIITIGVFQGARLLMICRWCFYICTMSCFHILEFFTTAVYNPSVTSSESYLVNHSKAYTGAFIIAFLEFWIRFFFFPHVSVIAYVVGALLIVVSQIIRSWAMITCGESFNHLIQTAKKENHVLITHGVYKYLRHPSYVGFYYWSIATQLVLNNWFSVVIFSAASLMFFRRRIPYEEESLLEHFPDDYEAYAKSAWVGIPFIPSIISWRRSEEVNEKKNE
jgi:protein-S-isoprenylcysteine O-methyltransferase